jgi:hypothetical protein
VLHLFTAFQILFSNPIHAAFPMQICFPHSISSSLCSAVRGSQLTQILCLSVCALSCPFTVCLRQETGVLCPRCTRCPPGHMHQEAPVAGRLVSMDSRCEKEKKCLKSSPPSSSHFLAPPHTAMGTGRYMLPCSPYSIRY